MMAWIDDDLARATSDGVPTSCELAGTTADADAAAAFATAADAAAGARRRGCDMVLMDVLISRTDAAIDDLRLTCATRDGLTSGEFQVASI